MKRIGSRVAERIIDMATNGSGVRDTGRVLKISPTTVVRPLKNSAYRQNPLPLEVVALEHGLELVWMAA